MSGEVCGAEFGVHLTCVLPPNHEGSHAEDAPEPQGRHYDVFLEDGIKSSESFGG